MKDDADHKPKIALGFALIMLMLLGETWVADQRAPNPASPYVWAALGLGALGCLLYAGWAYLKSK